MNNTTVKSYYSVSELTKFNLSCLPKAHKNILEKAKRENWVSRKKEGKGGGVEYALSSLPAEVQVEIQSRFAVAVVSQPRPNLAPVRASLDVLALSEKQKQIADARMALAMYVEELEQVKPRYLAVQQVVDMAKAGTLPSHVAELVDIANARKGKKRLISQRSLMQWVVDYHKCETIEERLKNLAPLALGKPKANVYSLPWLHDFLTVYQDPNKPSISACIKSLRNFSAHEIPTDSAIRRALKALPVLVRERGRVTGNEYQALNIYTKRDWEVLNVNECWIGDGHGLKAKVKHPIHGQPFQPEVTGIMDGRTRYLVGWSVHLSENTQAVCDALRHGIERCGLPNIYYSDNGAGEKNKALDAPLTGILPRLGIHHETGRPGNPQGRGIIERFWETALIPLAKRYKSYVGKDLDKETRRVRAKELDSAVNALIQNKPLNSKQQKAMRRLPRFEDFLADLEQVIEEYNRTPHSELPKVNGEHLSPAQYRAKLLEKNKGDIEFLSEFELELLFRPEVERKVAKGCVELFNNVYFSEALAMYHGEMVRVCYDIHDAKEVLIKNMEGGWICKALWDGNKVDAMPKSVREKAKETRLKAQVNRLEKRIKEKESFLNPVLTIEQKPEFELLSGLNKAKIEDKKPIFLLRADEEEWERNQQQKRQKAVGE